VADWRHIENRFCAVGCLISVAWSEMQDNLFGDRLHAP